MSWKVSLQASADCFQASQSIWGYPTATLDENQGSVSRTKQAQSGGEIWWR